MGIKRLSTDKIKIRKPYVKHNIAGVGSFESVVFTTVPHLGTYKPTNLHVLCEKDSALQDGEVHFHASAGELAQLGLGDFKLKLSCGNKLFFAVSDIKLLKPVLYVPIEDYKDYARVKMIHEDADMTINTCSIVGQSDIETATLYVTRELFYTMFDKHISTEVYYMAYEIGGF